MKRAILFILVITCASFVEAKQEFVKVKGFFEVIDGGYDDAYVLIRSEYGGVKNGSLKSNGQFLLKLQMNHKYVIEFNKPGYVQKKVKIDTHVPSTYKTVHVNFDVKLFPQQSDSDMFVYNQPVGNIRILSSKAIKVDYNYSAKLVSSKMTF